MSCLCSLPLSDHTPFIPAGENAPLTGPSELWLELQEGEQGLSRAVDAVKPII